MVFCSFTFLLLFMPLVLLLHRALPEQAKRPFLFAASLLFYGWGNPVWLLLLIYVMALDYAGALLMEKPKLHRKGVLAGLIALNLLPLFYFKYSGFFRDSWASLTGVYLNFTPPLLPAGISFFTFQGLSYLIDVYRGKVRVQRSFLLFGLYLSLFPQLVAGPIVRYADLEEQLISPPRVTDADMRAGLRRFLIGLSKKVLLADVMGQYWGKMNGSFESAGALGAWLGLMAFSFQIFFDFSGYSDMALGLGKAMGFTFCENFDRPYRSLSLTEFWRRWHMSLTGWFKEYVYIPLGGSHVSAWRRDLNVMIVWGLTGLWHGAGWHFVLWGLYFGVLLILEKRFLLGRPGFEKLPSWLRQALTYLIVLLGWGIFSGKGELWGALIGLKGFCTPQGLLTTLNFLPMLALCAALSFLPALKRLPSPVRRLAAPALAVLCLAALASQGYAPFVYFQF